MGTVLGYAVDEFNIFSQFCRSLHFVYTSSTAVHCTMCRTFYIRRDGELLEAVSCFFWFKV